jgi:hypothetical protein
MFKAGARVRESTLECEYIYGVVISSDPVRTAYEDDGGQRRLAATDRLELAPTAPVIAKHRCTKCGKEYEAELDSAEDARSVPVSCWCLAPAQLIDVRPA